MNGWLIVNAYVRSEKFCELFEMLVQAGKSQDCMLEVKTNEEIWRLLAVHNYQIKKQLETVNFIIFWDKDLTLAQVLEQQGIRLFNSAESIAVCDDKSQTQIALLDKNIRMPKTVFNPKVFPSAGWPNKDYYLDMAQTLGYPCIVKECFGSFGQQVYLAYDDKELLEIIRKIWPGSFIMQEYIASSRGRDIRVQVVGKKIVACMYRYNDNDFRANVTNGGSMKPYQVNEAQAKMALDVCRELGLDFGGIDIMFGENDEPVFCEANSNAHFKNLYDCTGINVADELIAYIRQEMTHAF